MKELSERFGQQMKDIGRGVLTLHRGRQEESSEQQPAGLLYQVPTLSFPGQSANKINSNWYTASTFHPGHYHHTPIHPCTDTDTAILVYLKCFC